MEIQAYSGRIRNYRQLGAELGVSIEGLSTRQREELLLKAAYAAWGTQMGDHLNGQFALVMHDPASGELFATRDIFGAELLYYWKTEPAPVCALNIGDILARGDYERELDEGLIQRFLEFNYLPGEDTLFAGICKLEPGGFLHFSPAQGLEMGRYWELDFAPEQGRSLDDWAAQLDAALDAAFADVMDPGEQADSFLSGGVDSSYLLAKGPARRGFCVAYQEQGANESDLARATAEYLDKDFVPLELTASELFANLDEFLLAYEQPSADVAGLALFCAAKQARHLSQLCFSGEGADEFFAGYSVYASAQRLARTPGALYYGATHMLNQRELKRYLKCYSPLRDSRSYLRQRCAAANKYQALNRMLYTDMRTYFEGSILFNSSRIVRGTGLDIRMPLIDRRVFDIARRLPEEFKADKNGNKRVLRKAASNYLPDEVAYRVKKGFPVPIRAWLARPEVAADLRRAFESETARQFFDVDEINSALDVFLGQKPRLSHPIWYARHRSSRWRHIWTIYVFIRWYQLFFKPGQGRDA